MVGHGVEVAHRSKIAVAPLPNQYHKHAATIEPIAGSYAAYYASVREWPVSPDGLEAFIADDLGITFIWEPGDDSYCEFYARYDPSARAIIFNSDFEWIRDDRPDLYISFLSHEVGHVVLRHAEALDIDTGSLFDEETVTHFLNHPQFRPREMSDELIKRAIRLVSEDPQIAAALRAEIRQERYEPQWMYDQAQHFAGGFIVPKGRILDAIGDGEPLRSWNGIHKLARLFGCSNSFMEVRLKKLGLVIVDGSRVRPAEGSRDLGIA